MCIISKGRRLERNSVRRRALASARRERRLAGDTQVRIGEAGLVGYGAPQIHEEDLVTGHNGQRRDTICWDKGEIWPTQAAGKVRRRGIRR